jgi:hypothetical protein
MNQELKLLYEQDQADRVGWQKYTREQSEQIGQRDRVRLQRVEELIASEALQVAEDYFHAAMIFQHGETLEHYWQAHELARKGAELGHRSSRWLSAAAYDRWLMRQGKPQAYGTQYTSREGRWVLYEVDPATTDAQRAEWNVPPLAQALQRAEEMNQKMPPP